MSRVHRSDIPPPVSLDTHPLRSISKKPVLHTSTPDLAKIGSNNSSTESLTACQQRRSHYSSHEDVVGPVPSGKIHPSPCGNGRSSVDPSTRYEWNEAFTAQTPTDPSTRYEWNETFVQQSKPKSPGKVNTVSEGYCRLNIFDEKGIKKPQRPASCGDYSVLDLPAGPPRSENDSGVSNTTHNYFTLEVLDDPETNSNSNSPSQLNFEDPPESEGVYFTLEETSAVTQQQQQPSEVPSTSINGIISSGYSYVELDTEDRGRSPPVLVNSSTAQQKFQKTKGKSLIGSRSAGYLPKVENTYDTLRHDVMKLPPRPARSISQSDYRSPSPRVGHHVRPDSIRQTISPPTLPYHKKDFNRIHSYHDPIYPRNKPSNRGGESTITPRTTLVRSHSPKSPLTTSTVIHDYDEVEIDEGSLTDDDVPIPLPSPTSPGLLPSVDEHTTCQSPSHDSMVQLIITDDGPLLVPRKRSLTADASNLRQFRTLQNRSNSSLSQQHHHHQQQTTRAMSAFANK